METMIVSGFLKSDNIVNVNSFEIFARGRAVM